MKSAHFLSKDITTSQDLSTAALDYTTTVARERKVEMITFKFSAAVSETVTITLDSANGATYDVELLNVVLVSETDLIWRPQGECNIKAGDAIKIECTDTGGAGIVYATIKTSEL